MPNHCEQDLYVRGPGDDVDRLIASVADGKDAFSANKIIPYPERWAKLDAECEALRKRRDAGENVIVPRDGYNSGGYEWCIENWGSKWGAFKSSVRRTRRGATFHFTSAWSPITKLIAVLSEQFPTLTFELRYFERGMEFQGVARVAMGRVATDERSHYSGTRGG